MPRRDDLETILILGSGPIIIGQACEFDYSGTQAVRALKEEGYRVVLVNSNPATIMTDPDLADQTYIEPITADWVEKIIERELEHFPREFGTETLWIWSTHEVNKTTKFQLQSPPGSVPTRT